jgi:hypothetical protein
VVGLSRQIQIATFPRFAEDVVIAFNLIGILNGKLL